MKYYCIMHQEALCAKTLGMQSVMDVVLRCVNKIRERTLNRRWFRQFLADLKKQVISCCIVVRWLSKENFLSLFWFPKDFVHQFLVEIDDMPTELDSLMDNEWHNYLAFLVDITEHLSTLNVRLQGKHKLFTNMCSDVQSFKAKLTLFIGQLTRGKLSIFHI